MHAPEPALLTTESGPLRIDHTTTNRGPGSPFASLPQYARPPVDHACIVNVCVLGGHERMHSVSSSKERREAPHDVAHEDDNNATHHLIQKRLQRPTPPTFLKKFPTGGHAGRPLPGPSGSTDRSKIPGRRWHLVAGRRGGRWGRCLKKQVQSHISSPAPPVVCRRISPHLLRSRSSQIRSLAQSSHHAHARHQASNLRHQIS